MPEIRLTHNDLSRIAEKAREKKEENVIPAFIASFMAAKGTVGMKCKGVLEVFEKVQPHPKASFTFAEQEFSFRGAIAGVDGIGDDGFPPEPASAGAVA